MIANNKRLAICVTGWHFPEEFYLQLSQLPLVETFVVSHKPQSQVPDYLNRYIKTNNVIFRPNIGYDWGCYQQFLETGIWKEFDYIFFMHDDVAIINLNFIEASLDLLNSGHYVVGNGRNSTKVDWPQTHLNHYAHSKWHPPSYNFEHDTVRGSFFATTNKTLHKLGNFEVFWDRFHLYVRFGNWSLISSCGKLQELFGDNTFAFLSDEYLSSNYLIEYQRGGQTTLETVGKIQQRFRGHKSIVHKFYHLCEDYMHKKMEFRGTSQLLTMSTCSHWIIKLIAGHPQLTHIL